MTYTHRQSIITKTPLRISLGGGGTDLPFYAAERGGFLIAAAIDEYITVSIASRPLDERILVQTTSTQFADSIDMLDNQLIRAVLEYFGRTKAIQIATFSTLPTGIGLGSSSTQIVGMVHALAELNEQRLTAMEIGAAAHDIERNILGQAGGIQDQYIAALGGVQIITIDPSGVVRARPLFLQEKARRELETKLILIYSGAQRDSNGVIKSQEVDIDKQLKIYDAIKEIGRQSVALLENGDVLGFGEAMDAHWHLKKTLSRDISSTEFDRQYEELKQAGSPGGKIVGAGGGGFFMMAVPHDPDAYVRKIYQLGYNALDFCFDFEGTHIINQVPAVAQSTHKHNSQLIANAS